MARRARLKVAGCPVHLIQRGHNRSACFRADADYAVYLDLLSELSATLGCAIHAYVLMTNHVHLLLTPEHAHGTSCLMKHLGQRYAQYVNRRYERSGTLWEGRFRSSIVQSESYLLRCYRYIELNPVRAGMVRHPRDYRWSSHSANADGNPCRLITPHSRFLALGLRDNERHVAYRALFDAELGPAEFDEIRAAVNGGFALGDSLFKAEVSTALGRQAAPGRSGRPATFDLAQAETGL